MAVPSVLSRFQGSMVGAVLGDCIGAVFEGYWGKQLVGTDTVLDLVNKIESAFKDEKMAKKLKSKWTFTDDTAMARSIAKSLIEHNGLRDKQLARRFTDEYFKESDRGYGGGVTSVFKQLADCDCSDTYGPASRQFDGQGSYGNGGAMRIAPAALFAYQKNYNFDQLKDLTEKITLITHSHKNAILGAILQCYAVNLALKTESLDVDTFLDSLLEKIRPLEEAAAAKSKENSEIDNTDKKDDQEEEEDNQETYCLKLEKVRVYAKQDTLPDNAEITAALGTDIAALDSVPAAVYSFLRGTREIEGIPDRNPFERTLIYAVSHGGDTDTIATMAAAIAGAYYGLDMVPASWQHHCEGANDALKDAELMYYLPS